MSKQEFLAELRKGLSGLPKEDVEERLTFYSEMIDDRMEEGFSEEEAVLAAGIVNEIIAQAVADIPLTKIVKEKMKPKRWLRAGEMILLVLGSPVWLSLGVAAFAIILSLYISLWAVIISLWAVFVSILACGLGGIAVGVGFVAGGHGLAGAAMIGAGFICAGLSILTFFGCKAATKGCLLLTRKIAVWFKSCFMKKEEA